MSKEDGFKFRYVYESPYKHWWLIEKRFLYVFWRKWKKFHYKLEDGYPNINEVSDCVEKLNK